LPCRLEGKTAPILTAKEDGLLFEPTVALRYPLLVEVAALVLGEDECKLFLLTEDSFSSRSYPDKLDRVVAAAATLPFRNKSCIACGGVGSGLSLFISVFEAPLARTGVEIGNTMGEDMMRWCFATQLVQNSLSFTKIYVKECY